MLHQHQFDWRWRWRVLPNLEVVDGAPCCVVESKGKDRLWLDPALNFAARFYEIHWRDAKLKFDDWPVMSRLAIRDFRRATNGFWFPWRYEMAQYAFDHSHDGPVGEPSLIGISEIRRIAVNDEVPDSLFTLQYPPGTVVRDAVRQHFYRVGENGEHLTISNWN
jgi:hypothetical protein